MHTQLCSNSSIKPLVLHNNRFSAVCMYVQVKCSSAKLPPLLLLLMKASAGELSVRFLYCLFHVLKCFQYSHSLHFIIIPAGSACMYIRMCTVNNVSFPFLALYYADKCVTVVPFEVRPLHPWALSSRRCWHRHEWNVWILQKRRGGYDCIHTYIHAVY